MAARHRIPLQFARCEIPAATFINELIPVCPSGLQRCVAVHTGEKYCDTTLGGIDSIDMDLVVDGNQALPVAAVESRAQIGEGLPVPGIAGTGMTEGGDPGISVTVGVGPIVAGVQIENACSA